MNRRDGFMCSIKTNKLKDVNKTENRGSLHSLVCVFLKAFI